MLPVSPLFMVRLIITITRPRGKRSEKVAGEAMAQDETGGRRFQGRNLILSWTQKAIFCSRRLYGAGTGWKACATLYSVCQKYFPITASF
jgi:hypothetical protein